MPFPKSKRAIYEINTLNQVICQVRFPPILKIDSHLPDSYQETIRKNYPFFNERFEAKNQIPKELADIIPADLDHILSSKNKVYEFVSVNKDWVVTLTRASLALTTGSYISWKDFRAHLEEPLSQLIQIYEPSFFSRIGLRYQNVIKRSTLGILDTPWSELIQSYISGPVGDQYIAQHLESSAQVFEVKLLDIAGHVRVQHGLADTDDQDKEQCYIIDMDFFIETTTEVNNVFDILKNFNDRAARLFRWCITDQLENALRPTFFPDSN
jgi:uncharacterized protein (TIGR04255 family)